ncbi:unnamed protein product [Clavelina lepadiformis]|uniref:Rhodanese domain-containing protein n=1 Tax=Clavelina lepadiformis TaxID=159417 RepID=A0ABP0H6P3_CLALP
MNSAIASSLEARAESCNIPLDEFSDIVNSGDLPIIDVREHDEVKVVRVDAKKFVNIPVKQFEVALRMDEEAFMSRYHIPKPKFTDQMVLICRSGRRSKIAIEIARAHNYSNVRHYDEGTNGWVKVYPHRTVSVPTAE